MLPVPPSSPNEAVVVCCLPSLTLWELQFPTNREEFESSNLGEPIRTGRKFQESSGDGEQAWDVDVVVPYCTVGFRSGRYAKKLMGLG